jgi:predicted SAM-dependent methyltransferase
MSVGDFDEHFYLAANPDVAMAIRDGRFATGYEHYVQFGRAEGRFASPSHGTLKAPTKAHRGETARILSGRGLELGALESPCPLPPGAEVTYCDRLNADEARRLFPELADRTLQSPDVILDVNREGLGRFPTGSQDFAVCNHVLEHIANPIACLGELFRVVRTGGHVVVAVPDKRFTFDKPRGLTSFEHLAAEYEAGVTEPSIEHYFDLVALFHPTEILGGVEAISRRVELLRERAEHAHVWDSESFRAFLSRAMAFLGVSARTVFEASGDDTGHEYFAILEKC